MRTASVQQVRDDLYYAELERTHDAALAAERASEVVALIHDGSSYRRASLWRRWQRHWSECWLLYVSPAVIFGIVMAAQNLYNPAHHYGGLPKKSVVPTAEYAARNWFVTRGPIDSPPETFRRTLVVERILRTTKGPIKVWYVRLRDPKHQRHLCVLENTDFKSVAICGKATTK